VVSARQTVTVPDEGALKVQVEVENTSGFRQTFHAGLAIRRPDNKVINMRPKKVEVRGGGTKTVEFTNIRQGCLSPRQGGPQTPTDTFPSEGRYNIISTVYNEVDKSVSSDEFCYGIALRNLASERIEIEDALEVGSGGGGGDNGDDILPEVPEIPGLPEDISRTQLIIGGAVAAGAAAVLLDVDEPQSVRGVVRAPLRIVWGEAP